MMKGIPVKLRLTLGIAAALAASVHVAAHADTAADVKQQCGSCHALDRDYAKAAKHERAERKAPPLDFAGNKFRREWLYSWLQNPVRLRPAGVFPPAHAKPSADGDVVDTTTLAKHPALDAAQAGKVADYLMTLTPFDGLIAAETYQPGTIAQRMGQMNFGKFKGCDGCHQDAPDTGGVSGPELYTAWQRLQPAFISAYIAQPAAWDPHTMMPVGDANAAAVHKLANYLKLIGEKQP
ncbi:MAG: c-type cytochrome [Denitromonas halophila]|nr:MAG: c-type cytochrome [Denitromonas halophila]TVT65513.1 MAG: c-type cytochrome [Denitromonas halophila]